MATIYNGRLEVRVNMNIALGLHVNGQFRIWFASSDDHSTVRRSLRPGWFQGLER